MAELPVVCVCVPVEGDPCRILIRFQNCIGRLLVLEHADWRDGSGKMLAHLNRDLCLVQFCGRDECYPPAPCFSGMIQLAH